MIVYVSRSQKILHRCFKTNDLKIKTKIIIEFLFLLSTFVSGSGRVGQQSNCINKPVILFSCVFRKKIMIVKLEDLRKAIYVTQENTNQ